MASTSQLLNQSLRRHVSPLLCDAGFQTVDARNGWHWKDKVIFVFNIRAVGNYFAKVTGWPPGSVGVSLGICFTFGPLWRSIKRDKDGRLQPAEYLCHMRSHLECGLDQTHLVRMLTNPAERRRKDIWWVDPDGGNSEAVAKDIAASLSNDGFRWFSRMSNPQTALELAEAGHDCFVKFVKAAFLAHELGDIERWRKYDSLAEAEARRIGQSLDRNTWYVSA